MDDVAACAVSLLRDWLSRQLPAAQREWLASTVDALRSTPSDRALFLAVSLVPRRTGKADLALGPSDLDAAAACRPGWNPAGWSVDQAARVLLLLAVAEPADDFARRLEQLCVTADVGELISFYRGLPLYPEPARYAARAAEGVRSNMKAVFEAVAHRNPYPGEQLGEGAWNQMVLKALFIGSALHPVAGLDARANPALARMLCDYAHERWAAGRPVSPELWRCVGPHADAAALDDLRRVLDAGGAREREAAALALAACPAPQAARLLDGAPDLAARARAGEPGWARLAGA